jgi:hypothetical protein
LRANAVASAWPTLPEPIIAYLIEFSWISLEIEFTQSICRVA